MLYISRHVPLSGHDDVALYQETSVQIYFLVNRPAFKIYKNEMFYIMYAPADLDLPKLA